MSPTVEQISQTARPILERYGVRRAALFGSAASGRMTEHSDIDILVQIDADISLLEFVGLKVELEEALGRRIDLVEFDTIKPRLREQILREQESIL
jgi:uncharacterized protein